MSIENEDRRSQRSTIVEITKLILPLPLFLLVLLSFHFCLTSSEVSFALKRLKSPFLPNHCSSLRKKFSGPFNFFLVSNQLICDHSADVSSAAILHNLWRNQKCKVDNNFFFNYGAYLKTAIRGPPSKDRLFTLRRNRNY